MTKVLLFQLISLIGKLTYSDNESTWELENEKSGHVGFKVWWILR